MFKASKCILAGLVTILLVLLMYSCSVTFEKRRYRPGYHVDIVHKNKQKQDLRTSETKLDLIEQQALLIKTKNKLDINRNYTPIQYKKTTSVNTSLNKKKQTFKDDLQVKKYQFKKLKGISSTKSVFIKNSIAWALWILAIMLMIGYLVLVLVLGFQNLLSYLFLFLPAIGNLLSIIGTFVKFIAEKKQPDYNYSAKRINQTFYYNLGALIFSIIGCVFSLLSSLISVWGFVFNIISIGLGVVGMAAAFQNLKDEHGVKTILSIIFSFLIFIMSTIGFLGIFKF